MVYIDSSSSGGQPIIGITGRIKPDKPMQQVKCRGKSSIIQLTKTKVELSEQLAVFTAIKTGAALEAGEFNFATKDGYWSIVNTEACTGMVEDTEAVDIYQIPITSLPLDKVIMSNLEPNLTATGV